MGTFAFLAVIRGSDLRGQGRQVHYLWVSVFVLHCRCEMPDALSKRKGAGWFVMCYVRAVVKLFAYETMYVYIQPPYIYSRLHYQNAFNKNKKHAKQNKPTRKLPFFLKNAWWTVDCGLPWVKWQVAANSIRNFIT